MNFVRTGFRTVRQNPALIFGEIAWRWAFGLAAWLLLIFTVRTIMEGIDVSGPEVALARSASPYAIADAVVRVLVQVLPRLGEAMLILVPALALLWIAAATIGRAATLWSAGFQPAVSAASSRRFVSLAILNSIRAVFTLTTFLAFFGTIFLVSAQFTPGTPPDVAPAYVLGWLFLAFFVGLFWAVVNWFLALAPIFIVRDSVGLWKAISASVGLYRDTRRDYASIATWFGLFRGAALLLATVAALMAVAASPRAGLIASIVVALVYFAIADWLYIARLAAYVNLASPGSGEPPALVVTAQPDASNLKLETET